MVSLTNTAFSGLDDTENYPWVTNNVQQSDDVGSVGEILQDLDFAPNLLLFHRLEHLDDGALLHGNVHALEHLGVLAATDTAHNLVVIR